MTIRICAIAALTLLAGGCAGAAERDFPVTAFDRLAVRGSTDVKVTTGQAAGVHASGTAAALDHLDIHVENGVLVVGTKGSNWSWGNDTMRITVTVPMLRAVTLSGSGDVGVDRIDTPAFAASLTGSGDLALPRLTANSVQLGLTGSGGLTAAGAARVASIDLSGSGDADLAGLKTETIVVSVKGSGDVSAHASRSATVSVAGSGDVTITGGARCTTAKAGSGDVRCS